eukprot:3504692-Rhodomonas_salina.1
MSQKPGIRYPGIRYPGTIRVPAYPRTQRSWYCHNEIFYLSHCDDRGNVSTGGAGIRRGAQACYRLASVTGKKNATICYECAVSS